jgi:hypothetical protein
MGDEVMGYFTVLGEREKLEKIKPAGELYVLNTALKSISLKICPWYFHADGIG